MELRVEPVGDAVTRAVPVGRWDITGAASIDLRLSAISGSGRSIIIDLTEVTYLSSMGIRSILMSAKAVSLRGARMVLLSPNAIVAQALTTARIEMIVPIHDDLAAAQLAVSKS